MRDGESRTMELDPGQVGWSAFLQKISFVVEFELDDEHMGPWRIGMRVTLQQPIF